MTEEEGIGKIISVVRVEHTTIDRSATVGRSVFRFSIRLFCLFLSGGHITVRVHLADDKNLTIKNVW